jgi:acyl-coenzyme A synthetase/AMP-(fatty) acid ligase
MVMLFTSGRRGRAKAVLHPQSYAVGQIAAARFWQDLRPGDVHWTIADTPWAQACWGGLFGQWHQRAAVVQAHVRRGDAAAMLRTLREHEVTSLSAPASVYRSLLRAGARSGALPTLRHSTSGDEALDPELVRRWRSATDGLTIHQGYGQAETTVIAASLRSMPLRVGSVGRPMPGWRLAVLGADGAALPAGHEGELAVAVDEDRPPPGLFGGYVERAEEPRRPVVDGWYRTGDVGRFDDDGYLWLTRAGLRRGRAGRSSSR